MEGRHFRQPQFRNLQSLKSSAAALRNAALNKRLVSNLAPAGRGLKWLAFGGRKRRWTTYGLGAGLLATSFIPAMGLAVSGGAYAIWWWVAGAVTLFCVGLSNWVGAFIARRAS